MLLRVIDFETTGIPDDDKPAAIVEAAYTDIVTHDNGAPAIAGSWQSFVSTAVQVDVAARAVHHITDAEIASGVPVEHALLALRNGAVDYFVAHNADFEQKFFTGAGTPWVDTYKVALRLWPDAPSHSNQVLRYWLGLDLDFASAMPPHRALPDCYVTANILLKQLASGTSIKTMAEWSEKPPLLVRVGFGKHRGMKWADVDSGYLRWCLDQDMDRAVKFTCRTVLNQRRSK